MMAEKDWDAPAHVQFEPMGATGGSGTNGSGEIREFSSLREALHWTMNADAPAGTHAVIRTASGEVIGPEELEELWSSLQGP